MFSIAATSLLTPLLALANQARVEDCDLAVHAEIEGVRRASLHLTQPTNASDVDIKKPKGGGAGAQQTAYGEEEGRAGKDASGTKGRTRESHQAEKAKRKSNASRSASKPPPAASAQKSRVSPLSTFDKRSSSYRELPASCIWCLISRTMRCPLMHVYRGRVEDCWHSGQLLWCCSTVVSHPSKAPPYQLSQRKAALEVLRSFQQL